MSDKEQGLLDRLEKVLEKRMLRSSNVYRDFLSLRGESSGETLEFRRQFISGTVGNLRRLSLTDEEKALISDWAEIA